MARVLYDYDAASSNELSLLADEVSAHHFVWIKTIINLIILTQVDLVRIVVKLLFNFILFTLENCHRNKTLSESRVDVGLCTRLLKQTLKVQLVCMNIYKEELKKAVARFSPCTLI